MTVEGNTFASVFSIKPHLGHKPRLRLCGQVPTYIIFRYFFCRQAVWIYKEYVLNKSSKGFLFSQIIIHCIILLIPSFGSTHTVGNLHLFFCFGFTHWTFALTSNMSQRPDNRRQRTYKNAYWAKAEAFANNWDYVACMMCRMLIIYSTGAHQTCKYF